MDAGGEIYVPQNFDSVSVAKESAQTQSPSFEVIERDPPFILIHQRVLRKAVSGRPSPQSSPRKRGEADAHSLLTLNVLL